MQFETLDCPVATGFEKIVNSEIKRKVQVAAQMLRWPSWGVFAVGDGRVDHHEECLGPTPFGSGSPTRTKELHKVERKSHKTFWMISEKEINDNRRIRQTVDCFHQNQLSATGQEEARQDETIELLGTVTIREVACETKLAILGTFRSASFTKEVNAEQV